MPANGARMSDGEAATSPWTQSDSHGSAGGASSGYDKSPPEQELTKTMETMEKCENSDSGAVQPIRRAINGPLGSAVGLRLNTPRKALMSSPHPTCFNRQKLLTLAVSLVVASAQGADCVPRPVLAVSRQGPNLLSLVVAGDLGINYAIEESSDGAQWTRMVTNRSSSGWVSFAHTIPPGVPQQFFRALRVNSADGLGGDFVFDGESFAGWEGSTPVPFRISDCAIVSGSPTQVPPENMFLCTTRRYTNFILRLEFKLTSASGLVNSGVQFRSERVAGSQGVRGYQADLGDGYWGSLWDESRRNAVLAAANQTAVAAVLKPNEWNAYVIQAEGPRLRFWINGYQTINYTEVDATTPRYGIIGLQVYSGSPTEASFRNISLEVLP